MDDEEIAAAKDEEAAIDEELPEELVTDGTNIKQDEKSDKNSDQNELETVDFDKVSTEQLVEDIEELTKK